MKRLYAVLLSSTLLLAGSATAAASSNICIKTRVNIRFENQQIQLASPKPAYYLLTNISKSAVLMDIAVHSGMSAGWASQLDPGHRSIIALDKPNFTFSCRDLKKPYQNAVLNCQKTIALCQLSTPPSVKGKTVSAGSYWVQENFKP